MAAPTVAATTPMSDPAVAAQFVVPIPAVQAGDYVVIPAFSNEQDFTGFTCQDASYTRLFLSDGSLQTYVVFIKEVTSAAGASSVTIDGTFTIGGTTGRFLHGAYVVRGADPGLISEFQAGNGAAMFVDETTPPQDSTINIPSVDAASAETLLLAFVATADGTTGVTYPLATHTPTGMTLINEDGAGTSVSAQRYHGAFQQVISSAGATGAKTQSKPTLGIEVGAVLAFPFGADTGPEAPTEDLVPSGAPTTQTGLTGSQTAIDDVPDPALDDGDWMTGTNPSGTAGTPGSTNNNYADASAAASGVAAQLTSPANAVGSSEASTSASAGAQNVDWATFFTFNETALAAAIPSNATITSLAAELRDSMSNQARGEVGVRFDTTNGTQLAAEHLEDAPTSLPASGTGRSVSPATLPTRAQLIAASFGVRVRFRRTASQACTYTLDWIRLNIGYTTPDVPGTTQATEVIVPLSDPSTITPDALADGTLAMLVRKLGNGVTGGNPTVIGELREGTTVRGSISSQAVSGEHRFTALVDQSTITDWTNLNFRMRSDGVSGALVELGAARFTAVGEVEADTTPPAAPTGLVATDGEGQATLNWNDNSEGDLDHYNVYRSTSEFGTYTKINGSDVVPSGYTDTVAAGTYWYKVTAVDTSNNESGFSNADSAVVSAPAGTPGTIVWRRTGALKHTSFRASAKVTGVTTGRILVYDDSGFTNQVAASSLVAPNAGGVIKVEVTGLTPNTQYWYRWETNGGLNLTTQGGKAKTAPVAPGSVASFKFAASSCSSTGSNQQVFTDIRDEAPLFFVHMGDHHYDDTNVDSIATYRTLFDNPLNQANQQTLFSEIPFEHSWSDHDFAGNGSARDTVRIAGGGGATEPNVGRRHLCQMHREYFPSHDLAESYDYAGAPNVGGALYRSWEVGRCLFIMLDTKTWSDDSGDTDDADHHKIGDAQRAWLDALVAANPDRPKFIFVSEPWIGDGGTGDYWGRYMNERQAMIDGWETSGARNIMLVAGDMHSCAFDDGTNSPGGWPVVQSAAMDQSPSVKGGPWTSGPYPLDGAAESSATRMYSTFDVADSGGDDITVTILSKSEDGTTRLNNSFTFLDVEGTPTTTRVTKDVDFRWRVYQKVSKDVDLRWKVSARVSKDVDFRWRTHQKVSRDVDLRWRVSSTVGKSVDLRWKVHTVKDTDVRLTFQTPPQDLIGGADLQTFRIEVRKVGSGLNPRMSAWLYENGTQVGGALRFNVPFSDPVGEVLTGTWDASLLSDITGAGVELRVLIEGDTGGYGELVDVAWDALHVGTPSVRVSRDFDFRWRTGARIQKDVDFRWRVYQKVSADIDLRWRTAARVQKDVDFRWRTYATVGKSIDLRWRTFAKVAKDVDLRWRTYQVVSKDVDLRWKVAAVTASRVSRDFDFRWRTFAIVSKDVDLRWRTYQRVQKDVDFRWRVYSTVSKSVDLRWRVYSTVGKSVDLRWRVAQRVQKDVEFRWVVEDVPGRVSRDFDFRWRTYARTSKDVEFRWRVYTTVSKTVDLRWRVYSTIGKSVDLRWRVYQRVSKDVDFRWRVLEITTSRVSRDFDFRWRVGARVSKDVELRWRTLSDEFVVIVEGMVKPKTYAEGSVKPKVQASWEVSDKPYAEGSLKPKVFATGQVLTD